MKINLMTHKILVSNYLQYFYYNKIHLNNI